MAAISDITLCSQALLGLGCASIASFDEGTTEAEVAANLYPQIRDALLSSHRWNFAKAQASLARLVGSPVADYQYAYQLPSDLLAVISAGLPGSGSGIEYRIAESRLETDADDVVLSYLFRPAEADFPPFFRQALVARLKAEFCIPLTESSSRADMLYRLASDEMRIARGVDGQQATPQSMAVSSLIACRG